MTTVAERPGMIKLSSYLAPTQREVPAEAEIISHQLLVRAGFIRRVAAGIYNYLPLMTRTIRKIERIVREEMDRAGAQELLMPFVQPAELWKKEGGTGRYEVYGKELLRFEDRHDREMGLGPTHEEVITALAKSELKSYRQLPVNLYQIQVKFRDEIRPRFGLLRGREFIMKDAYSFHVDQASLDETYQAMVLAYTRMFRRCGLSTRMVESDTGAIGGTGAHEFMVIVPTDAGENDVMYCDACDYAANREKAASRRGARAAAATPDGPAREVPTPGVRDIAALAAHLGIAPEKIAKTLIYWYDDQFAAVVIPGDVPVNEIKLKNALDATLPPRLATEEEVQRLTSGAPTGFVGPGSLPASVKRLADPLVKEMKDFTIAINKADVHVRGVNWGADGAPALDAFAFHDLALVGPGEGCPRCAGTLKLDKGIEVGNIFKLGTKYSDALAATYSAESGDNKPFVMGCYGLGVTRTAQAAVESSHDKDGIIWPLPIAPFHCVIVPVNAAEEPAMAAARQIHDALVARGVEVVVDDRPERAGVKFKDADLIGFPLRINIGKTLAEGNVELKVRATGEARVLPIGEAAAAVAELVEQALAATR